ncbi:MAG: hypothetical protein ACRC67_00090 [Inquilinus sp.]|uniref:hypothetical protein n=1 Tax=Inquilinus sp. TaxID=1932117 RepID=UPI003F2E7C0D
MKRWSRRALVALLVATFGLAIAALYSAIVPGWPTGKLLGTAATLAQLAGVVQLDVTEFWDRVITPYFDEEKYPFGPPSYITRQIIDNPEAPIRMSIRATLFTRSITGFWLIVGGTFFSAVAIWI